RHIRSYSSRPVSHSVPTPRSSDLMPSARIMIHQIQVGGMAGSNSEIEIETKELKAIQERLTDIFARHTGHTKAKVKRDTKMDKYMSAQDAIDYGIIDKILSYTKPQPELVNREPKKDKQESDDSE